MLADRADPSSGPPPGPVSAVGDRPAVVERVGWLLLACVLALLVLSGAGRGHLKTGDTQRLVTGTRLLVECVRDGAESRCAAVPGTETETLIGTFPPLQYGPTLLFEAVGLDDQQTVRALAWLNLGCLAALIGLLVRWAHHDPSPWPALAGALVVSGPMLVYGTTGFGEMLSATVLVVYVLALRHRRLAVLAAMALLVTISKETMGPFVVALAVLAGRDDDDGWLPPVRVWAAIVPGLVIGTACTWALNWVRYGSIWNERYLEPFFQARGVGRLALNVVHVMVAPGGGLLPYWPAYALLLVAFVASAWSSTRRRELRPSLERWGTLAVLGASVVGLARWWAPFGWVAWGPRLLLPVLPALGLLMVWVGGSDLAGIVRRALRSQLGGLMVALVVAVGAYVAASGAWFVDPALETLSTPDTECPGFGVPGSDDYWHCFDHRAWRWNLNPIRDAIGRHDVPSTVARMATVGSGVALVAGARARARRQDPEDPGRERPG